MADRSQEHPQNHSSNRLQDFVLPDLVHSLQEHDLGHLRIIAEWWGLELNALDARAAVQALAPALLDPLLVDEVVGALPETAQAALAEVYHHEGRRSWALFTRRFGALRRMGPGRRDRERPDRRDASPVEMLWYRGLISRAFFDTPNGPEEFAFIPEDLLAVLPALAGGEPTPLGRAATPAERAQVDTADDSILDHACTLLAGLRMGMPAQEAAAAAAWRSADGDYPLTVAALLALLRAAGLVDARLRPLSEPLRAFLEAPRAQALALLARAWLHSASFNELRLLPSLVCEGDWHNDPLRARQAILDFVATVREGQWWSLMRLVQGVQQTYPDYQRPGGDYDSWFIRPADGGEFLQGFEHWDRVDGELIRFTIAGPMRWLGIVDLAGPEGSSRPAAFRLSNWGSALLQGQAPDGLASEDGKLMARSDARLVAPRLTPRAARYSLARFCQWEGLDGENYLYRLTPGSLEQSRQAGLRLEHLFGLLNRYGSGTPVSLVKALKAWEASGVQARMEQVVVLRVSSSEVMQAIRQSRAGRFLGDPLGPTAIVVRAGAWEKVRAALAELGYLAEAQIE